jgi:hypothetical protein
MNRFFRRHKKDADPDLAAKQQREIYNARTPQEVTDTRAKNQRHKKVTADKWNQ